MFLQVHSATRSVNPDVKVVLTGYTTQNSPRETIKDEAKRGIPNGITHAVSVPPSPSPASVPQTPPATQKRRRDPETEKALEEFISLRQTMYGGTDASAVGEEEPEDTDYDDEGDQLDLGAFEGDEGDEGDIIDEEEEAELIRLGFTPVTSSATPTTTATTATTATTPAPTNSNFPPKPTVPVSSSSSSSAAASKSPAKNNSASKTPAKNGVTTKPATTPQASKTPVPAKSPATEDDKPRLSKRQKKKLRAEETESKEGGPTPKKGPVKLPSGLQYEDTLVGKGAVATKGNRLQMRYKGTLATGQVFDSNMPRGRPFTFKLGAGEVIRGWDEGLQGMRVGGKRTLKIPSALGYGSRGAGKIPPNANLTFEVELISKS
jgi:FKBP-type peptidyl-prolyl cis-trans isomerase